MESGAKTEIFLTKIVKKLSHLWHIISSLMWLFTTYLGTPWFPSHRGASSKDPSSTPWWEKSFVPFSWTSFFWDTVKLCCSKIFLNDKTATWDGIPPPAHQTWSILVLDILVIAPSRMWVGVWLWVGVWGVGGWVQSHVHVHAHICMHTHVCTINMIISCKHLHFHVFVCACIHV